MSGPFQFKQFRVHQDQCAMKVGTDGVLLGAWTALLSAPRTVLDIGAGTGLIALMLAQRCPAADIEALEIDGAAYEQCVDNFEASPWADRLFCYHAGLDEFTNEMEGGYDLIVSNPPFYAENVSSGNAQRDHARQNQSLPFDELLQGAAGLLAPEGRFNVIIPHKEEAAFRELAQEFRLYASRICHVRGHAKAPIKRSLLEFGFGKGTVEESELVIEKGRHVYTDAYIALTKEFYFKM
jgi:tRNA1Val (adenine37-N6)-methyltransferase